MNNTKKKISLVDAIRSITSSAVTMLPAILPLLSGLVLNSCNDDNMISRNQLVQGITVSSEDFVYDQTRSAYSVDESGFHFTWAAGDTIGIYPVGGDQVSFPISSGDGSATAQFDGGKWTLRANADYAAYFPFSVKNYTVSSTSLPVSYLDQSQNGNGSLTHLGKYDYQASVATRPSSDGYVNIQMKHLGSFVRFQLTMPEADTYSAIEITSDRTPFVTAGTFNLTSATPAITARSTSKIMRISLSGISTTSKNQVLTVYCLMAPVDLSGSNLTVTVYGKTNPSYQTTVQGKTMFAGMAYTYAASFDSDPDAGSLSVVTGPAETTGPVSARLTAQIDGLESLDAGTYNVFFYYSKSNSVPDAQNSSRVSASIDASGSANCDLSGLEMPETYYYRAVVVTFSGATHYGNVLTYSVPDFVTRGEKIDMGIPGLYFASCNLGASSPEQPGDLYAWGEISARTSFNKDNYAYYNSSVDIWQDLGPDISGGRYDAATGTLGDDWHLPDKDVASKMKLFTWTRITYRGQSGYLVTGFNGNCLFIPLGGIWTSALSSSNSQQAMYLDGGSLGNTYRYYGNFIRPVYGSINYPMEYVDLGLSVKWASTNVGACDPSDYGYYFAWGETAPKSNYSWSTHKYCNGIENTLTKYCNHSQHGFPDFKTVLDPEDDAAHVNWGGSWRMPTSAEQDELCEKCTWTWTTLNGVYGYKVTSNIPGYTDKWIFLPAAGERIQSILSFVNTFGNYWTSSLRTDSSHDAYGLHFSSSSVDWYASTRCYGHSVRPVCP